MASSIPLKRVAYSALKFTKNTPNSRVNNFLLPKPQFIFSGVRSLHTLEPLPFEHNLGLEPAMSPKTIRLSYNDFQKHWVESLNKMVVGSVYESLSLEETIMRSSQIISDRVVYNTASQIWNSMLCFNSLFIQTRKQKEMGEIIAGNINTSFGSYNKFVNEIHNQANTLFGGGFLWVIRDNKLRVIVTANAESPIYSFKPAKGSTAADFVPAQLPKERQVIFGINLWGYSYILDHELDRTKYINGILNRTDWQVVYSRFKALEKVNNLNYFEK